MLDWSSSQSFHTAGKETYLWEVHANEIRPQCIWHVEPSPELREDPTSQTSFSLREAMMHLRYLILLGLPGSTILERYVISWRYPAHHQRRSGPHDGRALQAVLDRGLPHLVPRRPARVSFVNYKVNRHGGSGLQALQTTTLDSWTYRLL